MWWWLIGCPKRGPDVDEEILAAVKAADAAWDARVSDGLAPVSEVLVGAWQSHRGDPQLGWRLVRLHLAEGTAATDPVVARAAFAQGRSDMLACLDADPLFAQRRRAEGWEKALAGIDAERSPCVGWGALAWVRWTVELGPEAASLDLPAIDALLAAGAPPDVTEHARGLSLGVRPAWAGRDREQAESLLRRVAENDPASRVAIADLVRVTGEAEWVEALARPSERPEDAGAERIATGETSIP